MVRSSEEGDEHVEHIARIRQAIDYIEAHLREDLTVGDVAAVAHYSPSHFHLIFSKVTGGTVAQYIRRRRLARAAWDVALSRKRILDIALEYRFSSQESFTRAFKGAYNITPGRFRQNRDCVEAMSRLGVNRSMGAILKGVEDMNEQTVGTNGCSDKNQRLVLEGVTRVGFYDGGDICPEDIPFPSCLAAAIRYLGEDYPWFSIQAHDTTWRLNAAYIGILAASGMAFGLRWRTGWHPDNADMMFVADPSEVIHRSLQYVGYEYELVQKEGNDADEELFREKMIESLQSGRPVLAFGVIGPPECCLITGYDEGGHAVLGWNYFQENPAYNDGVITEPSGYFQKGDWVRDTWTMIVLGSKVGSKTHEDSREILGWALKVARTPEVYGCHSGLAAYDAWARQIAADEDFATDDVDVLRLRYEVHDTAVGIVAECRSYAAMFLERLSHSDTARANELLAAAGCYQEEHDLMWKIWGLVGGNGHPQAHIKFAEPAVRREIIGVIREAQALDEKAASHLEAALE